MTLAAIAGAHKRLITSPPVAVFPHPLASDRTFASGYLAPEYAMRGYLTEKADVFEAPEII